MLTLKDLLEGADGVVQLDQAALETSEDLGDSEGLGEETLDLTGTLDGELVALGQLIHTQDSDDILEGLVGLQGLLDLVGDVVVLLTDDGGVEQTRVGVEGVDSGVDTQLRDSTRQHSGGIQVSEGGGRGRIGQIISGHVNSLDRGDGTLLGGGDTLLEGTHIGGQSGLVTDSGRNTTQKGRHLRTGLGETEDVVDEKKDILALLITEVLGNGQTGKGDTGTGSWGLVHLTEHESDLGLALEVDDTGLDHLVVEIVTLTSTLTDTGEHRVTTVGLGDVVDQLLDEHSLTDTGTTEETDLTTLGVGGEQVDDLDTSLEHLGAGVLVNEGRGVGVDGAALVSLDGATLVDGVTGDVEDTTESSVTDRDQDGGTGVLHGVATDETTGGVHRDGTDGVLTQVLGDLENKLLAVLALELKGVQNGGKLALGELHVNNGTNDGLHLAIGLGSGSGSHGTSELRSNSLRAQSCSFQARKNTAEHILCYE